MLSGTSFNNYIFAIKLWVMPRKNLTETHMTFSIVKAWTNNVKG